MPWSIACNGSFHWGIRCRNLNCTTQIPAAESYIADYNGANPHIGHRMKNLDYCIKEVTFQICAVVECELWHEFLLESHMVFMLILYPYTRE